MAKKGLKLGIIGLSEGNGHPYSWSAIFNGFDKLEMSRCPFEVIPKYLNEKKYPDDFLTHLGKVTHIWTQDRELSKQIAKASKIEYVCSDIEEMLGPVDAVILARDDSENHFKYAEPFLKAGIPIYIDKPLATSLNDAKRILDFQIYEDQVYTCSPLLFADEFNPKNPKLKTLGQIKFSEGMVPKSWNKYAIHIIEPLLNLIGNQGKIKEVKNVGNIEINLVYVTWESGHITILKVMNDIKSPIKINLYGLDNYLELEFKDSFNAFKNSLEVFIRHIETGKNPIQRKNTLKVVEIIQKGKLQ